MNQILENKRSKLQKKKRYMLQFYISFFIVVCIIIYIFSKRLSENNISKISDVTNRSYNITRLYSNGKNSKFIANSSQTLIIGTIKIPKINISYPIFSDYSDELLKISVCKLYGSVLNEPGNLCIIGHNYNNGVFFSNLYLLEINDVINIYDLSSNVSSYYIYEIYEVAPNNLDYLDQNTGRQARNHLNYL